MVNKNPWLIHIANFRKSHPSMPYSECLKMAAKTYTKVGKKTMKGKGIIQDVLDDAKEAKIGSKAIDYVKKKVDMAGYGRRKK
jgi:hypothetical protein